VEDQLTGDPLARLGRALGQFGAVLAEVRPEQAGCATPCPDWDVAALVRHVVFTLTQFAVAARGEQPDWTRSAPPVAGDWSAAFAAGAASLLDAWAQAGDLEAVVVLPPGERTREFIAHQQLAEFCVHAWDLARATEYSGRLDEDLAATALAWASGALRPEYRGPGRSFGAQVPVDAGASAADRLAGFFGRTP
jgi:uncharacterized protein (TIGR03086 family)